ncbi:glycoside hydrolase family 16 protein [Candidatus Marinimicrobia bacterium]|nr:glycoside hydrolase family 16 protein [Candidatus Neomarinimicrobiota bacterium]
MTIYNIILIIVLFSFSCQQLDDKTNIVEIEGCMDNEAINFSPNATISDQSCIFVGCTDPESINYNEKATIDDGNCLSENQVPAGYLLQWNDEFNGDTLNLKYWNIETWWAGAYNNELQSYTKSQNNIGLNNGYLYLRAQKETPFNPNQPGYTSGRITTQDKVEMQYGYWEIKAKLPSGVGTWPAIWMLNSKIDTIPWPNSGEIDIMEHVGYDENRVFFSIHNEDLFGDVHGTNQQGVYYFEEIEDDFHTYSVEWNENEIKGFVDGVQYFNISKLSNSNYSQWPYDSPFFLIINLAIGGDWGGVQGVDNSIFPSSFIIDYARMFTKKNED